MRIMACIINNSIPCKQSERELSTIHGIHCWFVSRKHIKQLHLVRYPSMDDCCMIDIWLPTPLLPHPQHPLSYLAPALENYNIPAWQVLVCYCGWVEKLPADPRCKLDPPAWWILQLGAARMLRVGWSCFTCTAFFARPLNSDSFLVILGV